jgi:geranylgeranyl reductase family protein
MRCDVLVVGAGSAGCIAAEFFGKRGYKILLIDRKAKQEIGNKVCGDAIGKHHFDCLGFYPKAELIKNKVRGVKIYSPDLRSCFRIEGKDLEGFIIDRHEFGQSLLERALDEGAELLDKTQAIQPIIQNGYLKGVEVRRLDKNSKLRIGSSLTIDAAGLFSPIRKNLSALGLLEEIAREEVCVCYREIRKVKEVEDPSYSKIYLNQEISPGGYSWIFPRGKEEVNAGVGVQMRQGFPSPKERFYDFALRKRIFKGSEMITGGGGHVPTRRPLECLVANGYIVIGDAAALANPVHGGGIGPSMISARVAGEVGNAALEKGEVSKAHLWGMNRKYMQIYGAKQASLDVFRIFLQGLSNEELNYGMKHRLIREEDLLAASIGGDLKLSFSEKTRRIFKGLGKLRLLNKLKSIAFRMRKAKELYLNYPELEDFKNWKKEVRKLFG